jgi:hypothetical protein
MNRRGIKQGCFGVLMAVIALCARDTAHAQSRSLMLFRNRGGGIDFQDQSIPPNYNTLPPANWHNVFEGIDGAVAAVSDRPNRIWVAGKTTEGYLRYTMADSPAPTSLSWPAWSVVPGSNKGGVCISTCYTWNADSAPAISSWGPGRLELFMTGTSASGSIALLHTWGDNGVWSGRWEVIGTGLLAGGPAAVSWGPGRTDVFVRGGGNGLAHAWFDHGRWNHWEDLGGTVYYSPSVTSMYPGHLDVSVHGPQGLFHKGFVGGNWEDWEYLDGMATAPAAASYGPGFIDILYYAAFYDPDNPFAFPRCRISGPYWWQRTCADSEWDLYPLTAMYWNHG